MTSTFLCLSAYYYLYTFGDVFEESGVSFTPFSGCFGLLANGMIPKPTYWTFVFYKDLYPTAIAKNKHFIVTKSVDGDLRGIAWNPSEVYSDFPLRLLFDIKNGPYLLLIKTVDEITCNPLKTWLDMGSPAYPTQRQLDILTECSRPRITTRQIEVTEDPIDLDILLTPNALIFFELQRIDPETDRGFHHERIQGCCLS